MSIQFPRIEPWPGISQEEWTNWKWQSKSALVSRSDFEKHFELSASESQAFESGAELFRVRSTPYYASLAMGRPQDDPIRKILLPSSDELRPGLQQMLDPLGERQNNPAPRIIHRYDDRCLFLVTDFCSMYCRYCTRKHFTAQDQVFPAKDEYQQALDYIRSTPKIAEVILSGGDPLTLSDQKLEKICYDLRQIPHVEIIRVGTRVPVVNPFRVTNELAKMFRSHKPVYIMTHFNHPRELTESAAEAVERFVDYGNPVFNQMVLLNGVNNHAAVVRALSRRLLYLRVKPYYMHQCDPSEGTDHLRTSIDQSLEIQKQLWGSLSGLAMPNLSVDIPEGGGKAGLTPNFIIEHKGGRRRFCGWDGIEADYLDPHESNLEVPSDLTDWL